MKRNYILSILVIAISFSNHAYSQLQYSLDSVELYLGDGALENKRIITKRDQQGHWANSNYYYYGAGTKEFVGKSEITYFPNYETKESITYRCFPFNGRDTCVTSLHEVFNEEGDETYYFYRALFAYVNNDQFIITGDFRSRDSTVLDPDGRVKTRYSYGYDMDINNWVFKAQFEYFYSQDGELDSLLRYRREASDLILTSRTHYERFPNELKDMTTKYFSDGEIEYYENQNIIIDGIEKFSSGVEYKLNGADTIITYQSNTQYSNLYSERVYNFFWDHGSLHYGGKIESYFLDDNLTQDRVLEYRLNPETGVQDPLYSTFYFYTDRLSSNSKTHTNNDLIIYPNPTSDFILIKNDFTPIYTPGKYYMIFDTKGQLIEEKELFGNQINISNLSNGNYFLKIENEAIKQFVVQH